MKAIVSLLFQRTNPEWPASSADLVPSTSRTSRYFLAIKMGAVKLGVYKDKVYTIGLVKN
ncbi:hypothetical protein O9929_00930 [Vibrio lentus]|nr:hypothetical protein [Vibrio lentus]